MTKHIHWLDQQTTEAMVLAIDPTPRGFGFCVFRSPKEPLDWGATDLRIHKNARALKKLARLLRLYDVDVVVIEDTEGNGAYRSEGVKRFVKKVHTFAADKKIDCMAYAPDQVREVFSNFGASTKYEIAQKIALWLPELSRILPKKRSFFDPEPSQYGVFDAAALALTHYYLVQ